MTTTAELIAALRDSLATTYPTTVAEPTNRPGVVTCAVMPERVEYEDLICDPQPILLTANVIVLSAAGGEQGVVDLLGHADTVADLIRAAGFTPVEWNPVDVNDQPAIEFTAAANGGG